MTTTTTAAETAARSGVADDTESRVDRDSHFNGLYETRQNLRIEGLAEGEIRCDGTLTVADGARVKAKVTASTITIAGELDGEVVCQGVFQIMPTGQVSATVSARRLIVQEGGLYNGEFRMIQNTPAEETKAGLSSWQELAGKDPEDSPLDALNSDEWWRKFTGSEPAAAETADSGPTEASQEEKLKRRGGAEKKTGD
jgi:cytoskeletal protein CcmA (bactofilin family)